MNLNNNISENVKNSRQNLLNTSTSSSDTIYIYECDDTTEGIFTAIYKAWEKGTQCTDVRVRSTNDNYSLFENIINVTTDYEIADKVLRSIRKKLSDDILFYIYRASLSFADDKASVIYHYLQKAFRCGRSIVNALSDETVMRIFELDRQVGTEAHKYLGFVRFEELENGVLSSCIAPKSNILPLIADHFADRLHNENWIILDTKRTLATLHQAGIGYTFAHDITETQLLSFSALSAKEKEFQALWSRFIHTIAIEPRTNLELQRNMMPLRYRTYMRAEKN